MAVTTPTPRRRRSLLWREHVDGYIFILPWMIGFFVFVLIFRAILSWVSPDPSNPIVQFINGVTEPLLVRVREKIPPLGMFDVSVIVLIIVLYFLKTFLVGTLTGYGRKLIESASLMWLNA